MGRLTNHHPEIGAIESGIGGPNDRLSRGFCSMVRRAQDLVSHQKQHPPALVRLVPGTVTTLVPNMRSRRSLTSGANPGGVWATARPAKSAPDTRDCSNMANGQGTSETRRFGIVTDPEIQDKTLGATIQVKYLPPFSHPMPRFDTQGTVQHLP